MSIDVKLPISYPTPMKIQDYMSKEAVTFMMDVFGLTEDQLNQLYTEWLTPERIFGEG